MENEISIFMARVVALIYIPLSIGMLTGQIKVKEMIASYEKSAAFTLWVGIFAVFTGTFLVHYHNLWVKDWPVIVTVLGWIAMTEGVIFIAFPKKMLGITKRMSKNEKVWSYFALVFGLIFGYFGFIA